MPSMPGVSEDGVLQRHHPGHRQALGLAFVERIALTVAASVPARR